MSLMYYERRLPHWHPEGKALFVTWMLHGALPKFKVAETLTPGDRFMSMDRVLDSINTGPRWLVDDRIAELMAEAFRFAKRDLGLYEMVAWVIMPNHVHMLVVPIVPLARVTATLKGYTGRMANRIRGRVHEPFWQHESYDHWVRDRYELGRIIRYIERNPVKAGLAEKPELYRWSSLFH